MKFDDCKFYVISKGRAATALEVEARFGVPTTWVVPKGEKYDVANVIHQKKSGLSNARNTVLDDCFKTHEYCIMLDDDYVKSYRFLSKTQKTEVPFTDVVQEMYDVLSKSPLHLAGCVATSNPFFSSQKVQFKHFCIASCILVKRTDLRFDTKFKLKEDYDYTLQHIKKYGGVARIGYMTPAFTHYVNKGGAVADRNDELEGKSIALLKKKWGDTVRDNPRRPNEVLLKVR